MARISLKNVSKVFDGKVVAVSEFSLDVADSEFMVIVGPSGCGKTTTLRMIAGLEDATSGNINIGDTPVNDVPPKDRDIAMVFQNYALYPHMTAYQNMAFALRMRKAAGAEIDKRIREAAKLLGIEQLLDRKPKALSGGQRQRVAVGRAIVRNPKAFLFDEPLSNLDAALRLTMRAELKELHRRLQTTAIYVTHDQAEAMSMGGRICVMHEGKARQVGTPLDIYEHPADRFVAGFLGMPPMNFFSGSIELRDDSACFAIGNDTFVLPEWLKTILKHCRDRKIVLGVRPENISLHQFAGQMDNTISATVNAVETFGVRTDIYLKNAGGEKFVAAVGPHTTLKVNDSVKMYIDLEKIHVFESGEYGRNIILSGGTH